MPDNLERLAGRLQRGDMAAFDALYEATYRTVYFSILPILRDRSLADDIVQDTYLKMLEALPGYVEKNFLAFLVTIARRLAFNERRRRKPLVFTDADLDTVSPFAYEAVLEIDGEREELIRRALAALEPTERQVFLLHAGEGLPHREIALVLDKPIGTITWLYARAVRKVRERVKED